MLLETKKQKVRINQIIGKNQKEIEIEGDIIVKDNKPDVLKIISTNGIVCVYKKEVMEDKIRIDGCLNTYIIYLSDDKNGTIRSLNTSLDFTQNIDIDGCTPEMKANEKVEIKNIECKILNGRKVKIKSILEINSTIFSNNEIEVISNLDNSKDIQYLNRKKEINSLIGSGETKVYAKDTISINTEDELAEVMNTNIRIINREAKVSYNKVLVKADAEISILYLTENNEINNVDAKIPVMGFIDMENIKDDSICDVNYQIENIIIKPNSAEMHSIYVEAEIGISCVTYENKDINLIEDMYSVTSDLQFNQMEINPLLSKKNLNKIYNINEKINIPELKEQKNYISKSIVNILKTSIKNGKIMYEGELKSEILLTKETEINSKIIKIPFNFSISSNELKENDIVETNIVISKEKLIENSENLNIDIDLDFNIKILKNQMLNIITEIEIDKLNDDKRYSMVIYFVKQGDSLWNIAKKFKSTINDIIKINNIKDNKIYVGQQLYIPRFINNKIAV